MREWEAPHGVIRRGEWVLMRTDWDCLNHSTELFVNADGRDRIRRRRPPTAETTSREGAIGWGVQTISTDAGQARKWNPPVPAHNKLHEANRYGLTILTSLDHLPARGAILVAAPLKIVKGTGSALALTPRA